jgi:hypothetical protein
MVIIILKSLFLFDSATGLQTLLSILALCMIYSIILISTIVLATSFLLVGMLFLVRHQQREGIKLKTSINTIMIIDGLMTTIVFMLL